MARVRMGKWILESDSLQWMVKEVKVQERREDGEDKKSGQKWKKGEKYEVEEIHAFCRDLPLACEELLHQRPRSCDADTLEALRDETRHAVADLVSLVKMEKEAIRELLDALKKAARP